MSGEEGPGFPDRSTAHKVFWTTLVLKILLDSGKFLITIAFSFIYMFYFVNYRYTSFAMVGLAASAFGLSYVFGPLVGGMLGEKYGYKKLLMMIIAGDAVLLILVTAAAGLVLVVNAVALLFLLLALLGLLSGAAVPVFLATVGKTWGEKDRNTSFMLFFWLVQLAPLLLTLLWLPISFAVMPILYSTSYGIAPIVIFLIAAIIVGLDLLLLWRLYNEPGPVSANRRSIKIVNEAKSILSNKTFLAFLGIMVGFFLLAGVEANILYNRLNELAFASRDIVNASFYFSVVTAVGIGVTLVAFPIAILALRRQSSFRWLVAGVFIVVIGIFIIGIFPSIITISIGLVFASIGFFISYSLYFVVIANSAPRDRMGFYLSLAHLQIAAAFIAGFAILPIFFIINSIGYPGISMALACTIGMITIILLIVYHKKTAETPAPVIEEEEIHEPGLEPEPRPGPRPRIGRIDPILGARGTMIACIVIIPLLLLSGVLSIAIGGIPDIGGPPENPFDAFRGGEFDPGLYDVVPGSQDLLGGYLDEGTDAAFEFNADAGSNEFLASITITLTWEDEPDRKRVLRTFNNEPDTFEISASWAGGGLFDLLMPINLTGGPTPNEEEQPGVITLYHEFDHETTTSTIGEGTWTIVVTLIEAGDFRASGPSLTYYEDTGNEFTVDVETSIYSGG